MANAIDYLAFSLEKLLVWIGKFSPNRILDAVCRAGRDVWNAWRRFFFGLNFDKHVWAVNAFLPIMPRYTEYMESVYERVTSEDVKMSLEDCLEHDFEYQEWYQQDVFEDDDDVESLGSVTSVPAELVPQGFGVLTEDLVEPQLVYGPHPKDAYEELSDEQFDKLMDTPHPNTSGESPPGVNSSLAASVCRQRRYNKKNARNQRTRVRKGYMQKAIEALTARLRVRHMITDQGMTVIDEAAMRASASDICASLKLNDGCTEALVQSASYLALVPDQHSIDAVKLAYNPNAAARRSLISCIRNTVWCGEFKSMEDF